jgi:hypothetical protein
VPLEPDPQKSTIGQADVVHAPFVLRKLG